MNPPFPFRTRRGFASEQVTARSLAVSLGCSLAVVSLQGPPAVAQLTGQDEDGKSEEELQLQPIFVRGETPSGPANPYANPEAPYKVDYSASPKLTEPLVNTPRTIQAIPKEIIETTGATSLKDVMRLQPGITLGTGEGGNGFGDNIYIRGYRAHNDIYMDGLRDPGLTLRETFATEQIEILLGPSSTIGGRGTTGGSINSISKMPSETEFTELDVKVDTAGSKRFTFDVNNVLSPSLAVRFNGLVHDGQVAGRDEVFDKRYGLATSVSIQPTELTKLTLDYYHLDTDSLPDWGFPYDATNRRPYDVDRSNFYGVKDRDFQKTTANIGTVQFDYDISETLAMNAQFRHGVTTNDYLLTVPGIREVDPEATTPTTSRGRDVPPGKVLYDEFGCAGVCVNARALKRDFRNTFTGGQVNFQKNIDLSDYHHTLIAGLELTKEKVDRKQGSPIERLIDHELFAGFSNIWIHDLENPSQDKIWDGGFGAPTSLAIIELNTWSVYLLDTFKIRDQWQISAGLRQDGYDAKSSSGPTDYSSEFSSNEYNKSFTNWNLAALYKPRVNGSIYAAISTSSNPPGEQLDAATSAAYGGLAEGFLDFEPERNVSYEIGTKWDVFDDRLNISTAIFQINKDNQLITGGSRSDPLRDNKGATRSRGISLSLAGKVSEKLSLSGGFTYLDTEVTKNPLRPNLVGTKFAYVPDFSLNLVGQYQLNPRFEIGAALYYQTEIYGSLNYDVNPKIPGYTRLDLFAEYQFNDYLAGKISIFNATNVTYYDSLYRSPAPFVYVAPGRSAQGSFSLKW